MTAEETRETKERGVKGTKTAHTPCAWCTMKHLAMAEAALSKASVEGAFDSVPTVGTGNFRLAADLARAKILLAEMAGGGLDANGSLAAGLIEDVRANLAVKQVFWDSDTADAVLGALRSASVLALCRDAAGATASLGPVTWSDTVTVSAYAHLMEAARECPDDTLMIRIASIAADVGKYAADCLCHFDTLKWDADRMRMAADTVADIGREVADCFGLTSPEAIREAAENGKAAKGSGDAGEA